MEAWKVKEDDSRGADSIKTFIIFCEDGAIEPTYFDLFKREGIHISAIPNTKQHHDQVDYATEYFRDNDLIETNADGYEVLKIDAGAQVWCVFDRDKMPNDQKDTAFNDSIRMANAKGIQTAWSNDNFELWILLHFEDVNPQDPAYLNRKKYYDRLTNVLKENMPDEPKFKNPKFDYYGTMKSKKNFLQYTYQLMKDNLNDAIQRAEELENYHSVNPPKAMHLHCPCTKVHLLVKELMS